MDITINGEEIDLKMKLGENGVAFFTEPTTDVDVPDYLVTSPVPGSDAAPVDGKVFHSVVRKIDVVYHRYCIALHYVHCRNVMLI